MFHIDDLTRTGQTRPTQCQLYPFSTTLGSQTYPNTSNSSAVAVIHDYTYPITDTAIGTYSYTYCIPANGTLRVNITYSCLYPNLLEDIRGGDEQHSSTLSLMYIFLLFLLLLFQQ